jgi:hypothetical protein
VFIIFAFNIFYFSKSNSQKIDLLSLYIMRIDIKLLFNGFINRIIHNNIKQEEENLFI